MARKNNGSWKDTRPDCGGRWQMAPFDVSFARDRARLFPDEPAFAACAAMKTALSLA